MNTTVTNESAATLAWLVKTVGLEKEQITGSLGSAWHDVRETMLRQSRNGQNILQSVDWVSDFWLTRGTVGTPFGSLAPNWMPPEGIDEWPTFGVQNVIQESHFNARGTNHQAYLDMLKRTPPPENPQHSAEMAVAHYTRLKEALVPRAFDVPAIQTEQVRVWLGSSLGHLLMSVPLSPAMDQELVNQAILYRLSLPEEVARQQGKIDQIGDRHLELLYNSRMLPDGNLRLSNIRTGQGEEWRDHWLALSYDIGAAKTLEAVQLAARLLRCSTLVSALQMVIASGDDYIKTLAVAVFRRWILTLKAMAWLEAALSHPWSDVRPQDLCCFALNATKPDWPHRVIAISHRSKDVKPELRGMEVWKSARCAIDANYVPSWETNNGMVWGLFAATPAIVRVQSPSYAESVWCRRELEISNYLLAQSDFLNGRWIMDIELPRLKSLDAVVEFWKNQNPEEAAGILSQFPPITEVCSPSPMPVWEAEMYRASAALRLIHAIDPAATPEVVNEIALYLQEGGDLPGPAPTNNPDGWKAYGQVFRDAQRMSGSGPEELAVCVPSNYGDKERGIDLQISQWIPDLQTGTPSLRDVLVAMEWLRVEWTQFLDRGRGDFLAINCQRLTKDLWESRDELSLHRGLAAMRRRLPVPVWVVQISDQNAESWPLLGEIPIFTEHISAQFGWMIEASFDRTDSQQRYPTDSGLSLSAGLAQKCKAGSA